MKRLLLTALSLSCCIFATYAQNFRKIKVDIGLGYASPTESTTGGGTKAGVAFAIEPHYRITDDLAVGLRIEGAAIGQVNTSTSDSKVSVLASYSATGEYYLAKSGFRPLAGIGAGFFKAADVDLSSASGSAVNTIPGDTKFGFFPRIGFEYGHFRMTGEYNIVGKGGYIAGKLGFFLGGGKK
ncbi:outer membrane beta-barrel protein [Pedobacter sp. ASV28]|uniref:outer membrane beta-barrel protein n=1 Tax=Pedobacter sp. ASV28 TaxID=2795123 RepID=UPI0018ECFEA7|nr:outer membrane beta-barrel protein [Pedobacter sp. ASV28]